MTTTSSRHDQFSRLLQILVAIRSGYPNARELAELCEVSRRTIYRDLEFLELAGLPVEYRATRQGYHLAPWCVVPVPQLSAREAMALAAFVRQRQGRDSWLGREAQRALNKVLSALPASTLEQVEELTPRVETLVEGEPEPCPPEHVVNVLLDAMIQRRRVRMVYANPARSSLGIIPMEFAPYRLQLARLGWYVLGHSPNEEALACRLDLIEQLEPTKIPAQRLEPWDGKQFTRRLQARYRDPAREVRLRASSEMAEGFRQSIWHPAQRIEPSGSGVIDLVFPLERPIDVARLVSTMDQVEVLGPLELRHVVFERASQLSERHGQRMREMM